MAGTTFGKEALSGAIRSEIRARDLYREISGRIRNRAGKRRLDRLALEEDGHRAALQSRYQRLFAEEFHFDPASPGGPVFDFTKNDIFTQAGALEVVSVAISAEKESISYYSAELTRVSDPEDVRLLQRLVRFEEGHKKRLQRDYERLSKRFSWMS
jgi:rubrerythrin